MNFADSMRDFEGGYVGSGEPIKGRLFLHDHDGRTCEIAGGAHYPVVTADEVRRSTCTGRDD